MLIAACSSRYTGCRQHQIAAELRTFTWSDKWRMDLDIEKLDWDDGSDEEPNTSSLAVAKLKCEVSALKEQLDASERQRSVQKLEMAALFEQRSELTPFKCTASANAT